ncbi:MAG: cytochrome b/b6 domain-containing protein [Deltaproteobacteria bacterium]|nr:cytochrome b/b6 domain-containing protein [Deltaproteobacteria bacterium]MCF8119031.1 cytochrome b/b6 domain-containing protein [Deltaproteobacteria bacterium]
MTEPFCEIERVYLYTRFERFWHWAQALLVMFLLLTGFEIHGSYDLFGFKLATELHNYTAWTWLILYIFILFWQATTEQWKQYVPTTKKLLAVAWYYMHGIFKREPHPVPKSARVKHNPLQRLTYLGIAIVLIPVQMASGILYFYYNSLPEWGMSIPLSYISFVHTACAYALLIFLVVHVYMTSTGHSITAHFKAMCTGWEEVPANGEEQGAA